MTQDDRDRPEPPEYSEIAGELKDLGTNLKEAFNAATRTRRSKEMQEQAQEVLDGFVAGAERLKQDALSGDLEKNVRRGMFETIRDLIDWLKSYAEAARSSDEE